MPSNLTDEITLTSKADSKTVAEEIYKKNLELLEQRRRAEELLYGISEGVFAVDNAYNVTLFNYTLEKMLGIKSENAIGKHVSAVVCMENEQGNPINLVDYCFPGDKEHMSIEGAILKGKYNNYYVNMKSSVISPVQRQQEGLVTLVDITKEKELEKSKDDFISITSHELRTPMTIIKSYLWMLTAGKAGELNAKQLNYVTKAVRGTERMLALINDMLNISRVEQGRLDINIEKIDLEALIIDTMADFKVKAEEKKLYLNVDLEEGIQTAYADPGRLREVFTNLVGNSLKFTDIGGIDVKVKKVDDKLVKISIKDTGKGIERKDMEKLFHKFGRLDNSYQTVAEAGGTGLGLYIVKLYIEKMGGQIGVSSRGLGLGSTFWFTVPITNIVEAHEDDSVNVTVKQD